jgi:hypothetical protein
MFRQLSSLCVTLVICLFADATEADERFRPEAGKFPPADKAESYMGQLTFVDHANRRGSLRIPNEYHFFRHEAQPFAMLPFGMIYHHGAPANLQDIPLGTMVHGRFYLPPDPKRSLVPDVNKANHAILLEDEPSYCLREGLIWKLKQIELQGDEGMIVAMRAPKNGGEGESKEEKFTLDDTTRFWRGREQLRLDELVAEGMLPDSGKKDLSGEAVYLSLTWQPMGMGNRGGHNFWGGAFNGYHISDIWLDETAMQRATKFQTNVHREFIQGRWMPGWIDDVEYGKSGHATVTATLFGGFDESLYADIKQAKRGQISGATETLKHNHGAYTHDHMAIQGSMSVVKEQTENVPLGSSGIQVRIDVDLVLEAYRPGRIVRIRPMNWPADPLPREEWLGEDYEDRYPTPAIYSK